MPDDEPLRFDLPKDASVPSATLSYALRTYAATVANRAVIVASTRIILTKLGLDDRRSDEIAGALSAGAAKEEDEVYRSLFESLGATPVVPDRVANQVRDALRRRLDDDGDQDRSGSPGPPSSGS